MTKAALVVIWTFLAAAPVAAAAQGDSFAAGYVSGFMSSEYGVENSTISVEGGTVTIAAPQLSESERRSAARTLLREPSIAAVRFTGDGQLYTKESPRPAKAFRAFPRRLLFQPLIADPRWPQTSGAVQRHFRTDENLVWSGNVGESFAIVGSDQWQFGLQATIFTQFDMKARHDDQMTDDFLVGFPYTWRWKGGVWMARLYHISTHTGDEFLLHHPGFNRVKLSYEAVDLRASYDVGRNWRVYGGPGYLYRRFPLEYKPLTLQAGAEYTDPAVWGHLFRPVAGLDLQKRQEYGWGATDISLRAGFQIEHRSQPSRRVLLLLEYYRGRDVNGQFFVNNDESLGAGIHVYF